MNTALYLAGFAGNSLYEPPKRQRSRHVPWTEDEVTFLRAHYRRDLSASQIARELDRTRNSVIGMAYRLGLGEAKLVAADVEGSA